MSEKTPLQANRDYAEAKLWHWAENRDLAFARSDYPSVSVTWRMIHEGDATPIGGGDRLAGWRNRTRRTKAGLHVEPTITGRGRQSPRGSNPDIPTAPEAAADRDTAIKTMETIIKSMPRGWIRIVIARYRMNYRDYRALSDRLGLNRNYVGAVHKDIQDYVYKMLRLAQVKYDPPAQHVDTVISRRHAYLESYQSYGYGYQKF